MLNRFLKLFPHSTREDKARHYALHCPYMMCPSNQPFAGAYTPKMKFMQKLGPAVYQYKCLDCGCLVNYSAETAEDGRYIHKINPAFIGGKPNYKWIR